MHDDKENFSKDKMRESIHIEIKKPDKTRDFAKNQKNSHKSSKHQSSKTMDLIQQIST